MGERLRVAINAQIMPGSGKGGLETVLRSLASLSQLDDGSEEYVFIGPWSEPDWLRPWLGPNARIVRGSKPSSVTTLKRALGPLRPLARNAKRFFSTRPALNEDSTLPVSDGYYEGLNCDVIHFPFAAFVRCALPSIYNPHDLQHLHYPEFFTIEEIDWRQRTLPAACRAAQTVVSASQFVKQDLIRHFHFETSKIQVIPWALPSSEATVPISPATFSSVREKYRITESEFALYPAMTWEHKNHIRLLEALAQLRDCEGLQIPLICTGHQTRFWTQIEERLLKLRLQEQVRFLGLVPHDELRALYRMAQFVVIPTLFEAASAPLFEAWQNGAPAACSAVTSLPEQAADAALLFDPSSVQSIASAIARVATDHDLRKQLSERGTRRLQDFRWERTAKAYRAVYRRAAGHTLNEEDQWLLSWDWMQSPERRVEVKGI